LSGGTATNLLGICDTCVALSLRVDGPPGVAGHIQRGDNVTLYATFEGLRVFSGVRDLLNALQGKGGPGGGAATQPRQGARFTPFTRTLLPTVKVLAVENPPVDTQGRTSTGNVTLPLDVQQPDAESLAHSIDKGTLYIGLLPPKATGIQLPAESIDIN